MAKDVSADKKVDLQHTILLNRLVSRSKTRSKNTPPTHGAAELFEYLQKRVTKGLAVEFLDGAEDSDDEKIRFANGAGHNCIRLRTLKFHDDGKFAVLLFEYVDAKAKTFAVVHTETFDGREIEGGEKERGAAAAHVVVRLPTDGAYDDGSYRCAVEAIHSVTRRDIERLMCKQLWRVCAEWSFEVAQKKGKPKPYKYYPALELHADVGRSLFGSNAKGDLSLMEFTKRGQKQSTGQPTSLKHEDFHADVQIRVSAKQGPEDPVERIKWATRIKTFFETQGYDARLYFRHIGGKVFGGEVSTALAGAADLLMCPRETILLKTEPKRWRAKINNDIAEKMIELLQRDELWERAK